jgi:hypothetical protein
MPVTSSHSGVSGLGCHRVEERTIGAAAGPSTATLTSTRRHALTTHDGGDVDHADASDRSGGQDGPWTTAAS